ncbi:MAG: hypothetical protein AB7T10_05950 [bacterium]
MDSNLKENSAIQNHINILQNVISRMAGNSANSKTWAITIISAIVVLLIDRSKSGVFYIAYVPLAMFFFLDCFYLGLERHFRNIYNEFVEGLDSDKFDYKMVYKLQGPKKLSKKIGLTICGAWSFSTTPFYIIIAVLIFIIQKLS